MSSLKSTPHIRPASLPHVESANMVLHRQAEEIFWMQICRTVSAGAVYHGSYRCSWKRFPSFNLKTKRLEVMKADLCIFAWAKGRGLLVLSYYFYYIGRFDYFATRRLDDGLRLEDEVSYLSD